MRIPLAQREALQNAVRLGNGAANGVRPVDPHMATTLPHRARVLTALVERHREMLLQGLHERARVPHALQEGLAEPAKRRRLRMRRESVPFPPELVEPGRPVQDLHAAENLLIRDFPALANKDEHVDMVRHHAPGQQVNPGEVRRATQQIDEPVPLLVVQEERTMGDAADDVVDAVRLVISWLSHDGNYTTKAGTVSLGPYHKGPSSPHFRRARRTAAGSPPRTGRS